MKWTITLEDEHKEILSQLTDEFRINNQDNLNKFKLLRYLDPYGDTFFNHIQMNDLIEDLHMMSRIENDPIFDKIILLAEICKKENHTYLAFYGD